jgi:hypothetical protein
MQHPNQTPLNATEPFERLVKKAIEDGWIKVR